MRFPIFKNRLYKIFFLIALGVLFSNVESLAQGSVQYWGDLNLSYHINKQLKINGEVGLRSVPENHRNQTYFRALLYYRPHKLLKFSLAAAHFNAWEFTNMDAIEIRTSEYLSIAWPNLWGFQFNHRIGVDQRWFFLPHYEPNKFVLRSRYQISLGSPNFEILNLKAKFYTKASFEVLRNVNNPDFQQLIDHDWIVLTFGSAISPKLTSEFQVHLFNLNNPESHEFTRDFSALRLRFIFHLP